MQNMRLAEITSVGRNVYERPKNDPGKRFQKRSIVLPSKSFCIFVRVFFLGGDVFSPSFSSPTELLMNLPIGLVM